MNKESWKTIEGYQYRYKVSNRGRVMSLRYRGSKGVHGILTPIMTRKGAQIVILHKKGQKKSFYVDRLVYQAFIGKITDNKKIRHLDGNLHNNTVQNLGYKKKKYHFRPPRLPDRGRKDIYISQKTKQVIQTQMKEFLQGQ